MIFGVAGKLESGKDTVSDYLVKNYGFKKFAFADNLKQLCMKVFGLTWEQCYTTEGKFQKFEAGKPNTLLEHDIDEIIMWLQGKNNWPVTSEMRSKMLSLVGRKFESARDVLQFVGTEIMRDCVDADIHAKIVLKAIKDQNVKNAVICDARFENERIIVKKENGKLILVDCVQTREQESSHRSETGLGDSSEYDHVIMNDKTIGLQPLYDKVDAMMVNYENTL